MQLATKSLVINNSTPSYAQISSFTLDKFSTQLKSFDLLLHQYINTPKDDTLKYINLEDDIHKDTILKDDTLKDNTLEGNILQDDILEDNTFEEC